MIICCYRAIANVPGSIAGSAVLYCKRSCYNAGETHLISSYAVCGRFSLNQAFSASYLPL